MNFYTTEFMLGRQRCGQWVPLITQQFRLRHLNQIMCFNLLSKTQGSYYFTLHYTTMCAPFYTSAQISSIHPKWKQLDLKGALNTSASCLVLRVWQSNIEGADKIVLTWGVHFSGLVYLGNKIAEIQPIYFKNNTVIFHMLGGYFTSHCMIKSDLLKPVPFQSNLNIINTLNEPVIYKRIAIAVSENEIQNSYDIDKLRKLHSLQLQIRNKTIDVNNIRDKINALNGANSRRDEDTSVDSNYSSSNVRYAPQLLTMNSLNKMLQEKPTKYQKQEMLKLNKEIEVSKFNTRLLSQERDKKTIVIRQLKNKYLSIVEENEERNSILMESYHKLSRAIEKLKEDKKNVLQHKEIYAHINLQLQQRKKQLLQELLCIYPIEQLSGKKYVIHGIYLPNSDVLADSSDTGISVALGYITHLLIMCSTFLQVPLRYPLTHYGSRSYITDNVSPLLPEKERDFPLFTRGQDKAQFTSAVYLLNKNIAQFRWLLYMHTSDLRVTLYNLLTFLQGHKEPSTYNSNGFSGQRPKIPNDKKSNLNAAITDKYVSLRSFGSISNISDPILDCIRQKNHLHRSSSPPRKLATDRAFIKPCKDNTCGRGLSEILAIPEAYLNKQITSDLFRNYMAADKSTRSSETPPTFYENATPRTDIKISTGSESNHTCDINGKYSYGIEQGMDPLDFKPSLPTPIKIKSDSQLRQLILDENFQVNKRISRSVGSYTDDENNLQLRTTFELGSDPLLNISRVSEEKSLVPEDGKVQKEFLEKWLKNTPNLTCSTENLYPEEHLGSSSGDAACESSPLMARTDALLITKSFNLLKPKP